VLANPVSATGKLFFSFFVQVPVLTGNVKIGTAAKSLNVPYCSGNYFCTYFNVKLKVQCVLVKVRSFVCLEHLRIVKNEVFFIFYFIGSKNVPRIIGIFTGIFLILSLLSF